MEIARFFPKISDVNGLLSRVDDRLPSEKRPVQIPVTFPHGGKRPDQNGIGVKVITKTNIVIHPTTFLFGSSGIQS